MPVVTNSGSSALVVLQAGLVAIGLLAMALMPPSNGPIALVALDGRSADRLVEPALAHGALLLGRGPLPGILIVRGNRAALAGDMLARGVVMIAAPQSWCGPQGAVA